MSQRISRRRVLRGAAAGGLAAAVFRPAFAVPETVKIGLVGPRTGPLALFYEEMGWTIDAVKKFTGNATPETVIPVSDQCEINGMPCVTCDDPLESYFFGRKGDPKKGFEWTYNFFFSGASVFSIG